MREVLLCNGDCLAEKLSGHSTTRIVPWRDALHEGPVPLTEHIEDCSSVRARFIAAAGWGEYEAVRTEFEERDRVCRSGSIVGLYFEDDLYDMLQLAQILYYFGNSLSGCPLYVVPRTVDSETLTAIRSEPVTAQLVLEARSFWLAFTASDPRSMFDPAICNGRWAAAAARYALTFPSPTTGLRLEEERVVAALCTGSMSAGELFQSNYSQEEQPYLGDTIFYWLLTGLCSAGHPLIETSEKAVSSTAVCSITEFGREVREGRSSRFADCTWTSQRAGLLVDCNSRWCSNGKQFVQL